MSRRMYSEEQIRKIAGEGKKYYLHTVKIKATDDDYLAFCFISDDNTPVATASDVNAAIMANNITRMNWYYEGEIYGYANIHTSSGSITFNNAVYAYDNSKATGVHIYATYSDVVSEL